MEQIYNNKMDELGYGQFVCDIFLNWEDVKDEILLPDRKKVRVMERFMSFLVQLMRNLEKNSLIIIKL